MIETILYVLSFAAGIALFLYLLSLYHHIKDRPLQKQKKQTAKPASPQHDVPIHQTFEPAVLRERTCPVCGSKLSRYEALYASKIVKDSTKILIYGCRYCYKPDEDPDKKKKSDI